MKAELKATIYHLEATLIVLLDDLKKERELQFNRSKEKQFYSLHRQFQLKKRQLLELERFEEISELTQV